MTQPDVRCPHCGAGVFAISGDAVPRKGDISICDKCCKPAIMDINPISLRRPDSHAEIKYCNAAIRRLRDQSS